MPRTDGREPHELRPVSIETGVQATAAGSALVRFGDTHVLCAASLEPRVPPWLAGSGSGWLTAEYGMLPGATPERQAREGRRGPKGRTVEIQRLIGRSLRQAVDLSSLGEATITVDCDVLQADGGTRTAAITGGWVALALCLRSGAERRLLAPVTPEAVAAISVGVVGGQVLVDLPYEEDAAAEVDCNVVLAGATSGPRLVEVQGSAEGATFARDDLDRMLDLAEGAFADLTEVQRAAVEAA